MFKTIDELKLYQKQLKPSNDNSIYYYLITIYQHLLMREESPGADINEVNSKNLFSNTLKQKANENGISLRNFLQYFDIQEFMCERLFRYLDKTKTGQLTKNEFVNGLDTIFFGSVQELYKMVFYMCDFNEKGKIHKFNMKLILSYIPVNTYEEQKKYIENINSVINNYFTDLDKRFPEKTIKIDKEIDFDMYKNDIEDYIKDKNNKENNKNFKNNGSFFLFINLISYIYNNNPLNKENMNFSRFLKNKFLLKLPKKTKPENTIATTNTSNNTNNNNNTNPTNKEKENSGKNNFLAINNPENNKNTNKSPINKSPRNKAKARSNSLYNTKTKKTNNITSNKNVKDLDINKNLFSDKDLVAIAQLNKKISSSEAEKEKEKNKKDFQMNLNELKKNKLRSTKKDKEVRVTNLSPTKNKSSGLPLEQEIEENNINNNNTDKNIKNNEYADILYKYCEEDSSKFIKKYYAEIRGKDILFFTSKLKNELCTIWNISKCIIIQMEKISISKYIYFPIKFINYNQSFCLIYFEEQDKRQLFVKKCEENTSYTKIEDHFEFKEKIGEGHFGVVKICIEKNTGKEYAVKIMDKNKIKKKDLQFLIQERNYMVLIKHPNIVSLIHDYEDENCIYFVMEYFKGGDLSKYMKKIKENSKEKNLERIGAKIIKIIAQGVEYLNQFGIVHRDLKPENIVFGIEDDIKSIKIIDLGVAVTLPFGKQSSDPIGTLAYISPEMFTHTPYSYKVDVWSIGVLLYWLTSGGLLPFDDENNDEKIMGKKVVFMHQEYPEKYFGDKSKGLFNLIDKALEKNPEKRINIHAFLAEEWLNKYNK